MAGAHPSQQRGLGAEFTEFRPYRQGDDPRRLDWKLLARTDKAFQRISTERATILTMIVVDASASMAFPANSLDKWMHARQLTLGLAAVAHQSGDPVGILVAGARIDRVAPRTRRGVVAEVARALGAVEPDGGKLLSEAIHFARAARRIVVISDFLEETEEIDRRLRELVVEGHEVHAIHIVAREELEQNRSGFLAVDPEDARIKRPITDQSWTRYREAFDGWRQSFAAQLHVAGVAYFEVVTNEEPAHAVRRIAAGVA